MVDSKPTSTGTASQMTPGELTALAGRLRARAGSVLMKDQPHQAADLRQAATLIDQHADITAEILSAGSVIGGLSRLLEVGGA